MAKLTRFKTIIHLSSIILILCTHTAYSNGGLAQENIISIGQNYQVQTPVDVLQMTPMQMNVKNF